MSDVTPIERFLGPIDASRGPFGLLGLTPADYDPEVIREALRARLLQLSRHRQAASTEADEVRLALHVAAAQLSDPEVRRLVLRQQGIGDGRTPEPNTPTQTRPHLSGVHPGDLTEFQAVALRVLAHSGGWNEFAKRRLGALAHAYALDMEQLRRVLKAVAHERSIAIGGGAPPRGRDARAARHAGASAGAVGVLPEHWRRSLAITTVVLFAATAAMAIWLLSMLLSGPGEAPERTVAIRIGEGDDTPGRQASARTERGKPPETQAIEPATSLEISTSAEPGQGPGAPADLLAQLRAAGAGLRADPQAALDVFARVLRDVGGRWTEIDAPTLQALRVELSNFQLAAIRADRDTALAAADAIALPANAVASDEAVFGRADIARASFSAGLMARLNRDDLISSIGSHFRNVLVRLSPDGSGARSRDFWPGVALGLEAIARRYVTLAGEPQWRGALGRGWSGWIEAMERLRAEAPEAGQSLLLDTVERALIDAPDPALSQAAHETLSRLVALIDFIRSDGRAAQRLIMWFDDSRVPTSALSLVTSRIVFSSLIPGLGPEMMLRPDATEATRSQLRDDYALKLGLPVSSEDRAVADLWRARTLEALEARPASPGPIAALEHASVLAMLNVSATLRWAGQDEQALKATRQARAQPLLESALQVVQATARPEADPARMTSPSRHPDGAWARRYLAAMRNAGVRQELLNELRNTDHGPRGPVDADVLAEAASYGGPTPLRRSAQRVVMKFGADPYVVNALLESTPNAARTQDVSEMVEHVSGRTLPSTRDPAWRAAARRALLERMVEMLGRRTLAEVEGLEQVLRRTYEDRASAAGATALLQRPGARPSADSLPSASAAQLAAALRQEMASHARRFSEGQWTTTPLNALDQKHQARIRLAGGALQEFAAHQLGLAEVMAYVVAAERSSKADNVRDVLRRLGELRREAPHVFHQIEAAEEAMLRLWLIRLGEEPTP